MCVFSLAVSMCFVCVLLCDVVWLLFICFVCLCVLCYAFVRFVCGLVCDVVWSVFVCSVFVCDCVYVFPNGPVRWDAPLKNQKT